MSDLLELVNVTKQFGDFTALKEVSLEVGAGQVVCLVGPSGSGKSTLLRTINMLEPIDGGAIFFDGELIGQSIHGDHRRAVSKEVARRQTLNFGMVFQSFNLFPSYTALENVALAPTALRRGTRRDVEEQARDLLAKVGLADKQDNYPSELSGGQQQRVAIARALAMKPRLLLFDEPTSALDPELVDEVLNVMSLLAQQGSTMLVVTHEMKFAEAAADEIVMMDAGCIIERGAPHEILHEPQTVRAQRFFSSVWGTRK